MSFPDRLRSLGWFLVAAAWFLFSDLVAFRAASGLSLGEFEDPLYRIFLLFLLILGYGFLSRLGQRRITPRAATALVVRPGWGREFALGAALGWAGVLACALPAALIGVLVITFFTSAHQFFMVLLDLIGLAAGTLAIEMAFRGYPFLRLAEAMGPALATLFMAAIYAIWRTHSAPSTTASVLTSFFLGSVLAIAVLRTRALWVGWGFHFAWAGILSIILGLPVAGSMSYSPVIVTNMLGPGWISGNGQGPEGSAFGVLFSFLLIFVMVRITSDLRYKYGFPPVVPAGIPVDIDAAARRQHEAAMAQAASQPPPLVQILPAQPSANHRPLSSGETEPGADQAPEERPAAEDSH